MTIKLMKEKASDLLFLDLANRGLDLTYTAGELGHIIRCKMSFRGRLGAMTTDDCKVYDELMHLWTLVMRRCARSDIYLMPLYFLSSSVSDHVRLIHQFPFFSVL